MYLLLVITWNNKILDYEIETYDRWDQESHRWFLETIRFSITRLKQWTSPSFDPPLQPWNNKILDYEIETYNFSVYAVYAGCDLKQ